MEAAELDSLIDDLESALSDIVPLKTQWRPIWDLIRQIGSSFKGIRYPTPHTREQNWARFQALVQRVKEVQAEENQTRERMGSRSERYKNEILSKAACASPPSGIEEAIAAVLLMPLHIVSAAINAVLPGPPIDETKETLKACSQALAEGWQLLSEHKDDMLGRDKQVCFEALNAAKETLQYAWDRWKDAQQEAYEARCRNREEREAKRSGWRERVESNIDDLKQHLERLIGALAHKESHLDELRDKRDSAWSDSFRERVEGWIDEEESNISELREKIARVETWLDEAREKLR